MKKITFIKSSMLAIGLLLASTSAWGATAFPMSGGAYSEGFADIANWTDNFAAGTGASSWAAVAVNASGTLGDGVKITTATSAFKTGSTAGVQKGTLNIQMLSTSTTNSCAIDLLLDFTGRNAGTISFDAATVFNSTGNRDSKLKLFYSTDGTTFTELTGTNLPFTARNNVPLSSSITTISLPIAFNNSATARLRFYEYSTSLGGTSPAGSQPKISIDNIAITSTATGGLTAPTLTPATATVDAPFDVTFTDDAASQAWVLAAGTVVSVGGTALTGGYAISNGKITFTPSASVPVGLLQTAGVSKAIIISKTGYLDATVSQTIGVGAANKLAMKTQPTAPSIVGGALTAQPAIYIQDQYGNTTTSTADVVAAVSAGSWTLGGTATVAGVAGTTTFSGLTATSEAAVTGATIAFTSAGLTGVTSSTFNLAAPIITLTAAVGATVDAPFNMTFTENATWRAAITAVKISTTTLSAATDYVITAGNLQFTPSASSNALLRSSGSKSVTVVATGYATTVAVLQSVGAGVPTAANSTATISAALAAGVSRTITLTAKDQYGNLVSGYAFKYDATITNDNATTSESYTIGGAATTASATDVSIATTNISGVATLAAVLPATIDGADGINLQMQLSDGLSNVGSAFAFHQLLPQTISFGGLSAVIYGDADYSPGATSATSGINPITYSSSNPLVATIVSNQIHIVGVGSTNIVAAQAGDATYNAALDESRSLTVDAKTLTSLDAVADNKVYTGTNGATITGTLTGVVSPDVVTLVGTGTFANVDVADGIAVTSTSTLGGAGAANYTLTQPTGLTANITKAEQTITFGALAAKTTVDANYSPGATSPATNVTYPMSYASSNGAVATIISGQIHITGVGTTTITASHSGSNNYNAAVASVDQTLTVAFGAPVADVPSVLTGNSFLANWAAVPNATNYILDVYTKTAAVTVSEGFDGGSTAPLNWTFTGITATYTSAGNFGATSPSLKIDDTNDVIMTPAFSAAATQMSFWLKGQTTTGSLLVEGYNGATWVTIENIVNPSNTATTHTYNTLSTPSLPSNIVRFRYTYTKTTSNLSFDDVTYTYGTSSNVPVTNSPYAISDGSIWSKFVLGLPSYGTYYYTVKANDGTNTSAASNERFAVLDIITPITNPSSTTSIYSANGRVNVSGATDFAVYNTQGMQVAVVKATEDVSSVALRPGIYVVKTAGKVQKVVVR